MRRRDLLAGTAWLLLGLFLLSGGWAVRVQERIAGQVIRLHVLAASDSPEDQARKLRVRDAVLSRTAPLLRDAGSRGEAERILREHLPDLRDAAADLLSGEGCTDGVSLELAETDFPTRVYGGKYEGSGINTISASAQTVSERDGFALPAGRYLALRAVIGPGAGENWWCVVFPPLCGGGTEEAIDGDTEEASNVVTKDVSDAGTEKAGDVRRKEAGDAETAEDADVVTEKAGDAGPEELPMKSKQEAVRKPRPDKPSSAAVSGTAQAGDGKREPAKPAGTAHGGAAPAKAAPASAPVHGLPSASRQYEIRFRVVELWGRIQAALS